MLIEPEWVNQNFDSLMFQVATLFETVGGQVDEKFGRPSTIRYYRFLLSRVQRSLTKCGADFEAFSPTNVDGE